LWETIKQHKNVEYIGTKHAKELKNYISASKVCLNPYQFDLKKTIGSRSPLKILNYIAQYKVVVTSIDSEIKELSECIIYRVYNSTEFIEKLKIAVMDGLFIDKNKVKQYLEKNSYSLLINKILKEI